VPHIYRGDTLQIPMTATSPSGTPIDFTGSTVEFELNFPTPITQSTSGVVIDTSVLGSINVTVDKSLTLVPPTVYKCSLSVIFADGTRKTYYSLNMVVEGVT